MEKKLKRKSALFLALSIGALACGCDKDKTSEQVLFNYSSETTVTEKAAETAMTTTLKESECEIKTEDTTEKKESEITLDEFKSELVVVGDSIAYGYASYERLPANHVFAQQGINLSSVRDEAFMSDYGDGYVLDIISSMQPKYLMLSMGINEIGNKRYEDFAKKYKELAEDFHRVSPDSIIYVAGLTPVSSEAENDLINNENINEHNKMLKKSFNGKNNIYYVYIGNVLESGSGNLNEEYSGGDGIHLNSAAYDLLIEELLKFTNKNI